MVMGARLDSPRNIQTGRSVLLHIPRSRMVAEKLYQAADASHTAKPRSAQRRTLLGFACDVLRRSLGDRKGSF